MGVQYPIMSGSGLAADSWCLLGTFTASSGVRMLRLDLTTQTFPGTFQSARILFSTNNGVFVMNTYDTPPAQFNAWADVQTTSPEWFHGTLSTDIAVRQNSNTSYSFYLKITPNNGVGFFTVYHSTGDSFQFLGTNAGTTRPSNGVYPLLSQMLDHNMIDAASAHNPTFTGKVTCNNFESTGLTTLKDFSASGFVALPPNAVAIESVAGLTSALNSKAPTQNPTFTGNVQLPQFQIVNNATLNGTTIASTINAAFLLASNSFSSTYGTLNLAANSSQTAYTLAGSQRGFIFLDSDSTNASSTVAYFSNMSGVNYLSIVARNGNAFGTQNMGTAVSGTWNMNVTINSAGAIRVSVPNAGFVRWNIIFVSVTV